MDIWCSFSCNSLKLALITYNIYYQTKMQGKR